MNKYYGVWEDIPSLELLRTFEVVARYQSFTSAARELHVTQAAISHQIRALEDFLGFALFVRKGRPISLTPEGQTLLPAVIGGLQGIKEVLGQLREDAESETLVVQVGPMFGANWLAHRIGEFYRRYPEVTLQLKIVSFNDLPDFARERLDVAIPWGKRGQEEWDALHVDRLFPLSHTPVCSPQLLREEHPITQPADLSHYPLIHSYSHHDWKVWLRRAGSPEVSYRRGLVIEDFNIVMTSAMDGQGVALCGLELVRRHLEAGRLIQLFDTAFTTEEAYHLVCPPEALERPVVQDFRTWLLSQT
jgi:LysR family glycine cleavage system transcriptional activator